MVDKRGAEEQGQDEPELKKARSDAPSAAKPALNLEALAKAKALLEKQKALREKLKKLPQVGGATAPAAAAAAAPGAVATLAASADPLAPGGQPPGANPVLAAAAHAAKVAELAARLTAPGALARPVLATAPGGMPLARPVLAVRPSIAAPLGARTAGAAGPRPLLLDAAGREVDEAGNIIQAPRVPVTSSLINQRREEPPPESVPASPPPPQGPSDADFVDPSVAGGGRQAVGSSHRQRRGALDFVEEGVFARQAEIMRLKAKYGEADFRKHLPPHLRRPARGPAGPAERQDDGSVAPDGSAVLGEGIAHGANLVPLGVREEVISEEDQLRAALPEAVEPPAVEWWDRPLLEGGQYYCPPGEQQQQSGDAAPAPDAVVATAPDGGGGVMVLRLGKLTCYVEHPVLLEPPAAAPPPPPQPLKLTKRELKKMRTQRRQAREKEKQELVRQGLLEPPKPKVKLSNLMRVLGEQATLDPTAIEAEVRRQMAERQAAHDDRNLARMLTPAERREKKLRKLFDAGPDGGRSSLVAVYRVADLSSGQHRFKVDVNARENHMSGVMLLCPGSDFSLVVVEGCPKAMKRYAKLMLRRIDWTAAPLPLATDMDQETHRDGDNGEAPDRPPNSCHLVWEGVVGAPAFKDFVKEEAATPAAARKLLEQRGIAHYWDAAATFDPASAPLIELP